MIDLLYYLKENKSDISAISTAIKTYCTNLANATGYTQLTALINGFDYTTGVDALILAVRNILLADYKSCTVIDKDGIVQKVNCSIESATKICLDHFNQHTTLESLIGDTAGVEQTYIDNFSEYRSDYYSYIVNYLHWVFDSVSNITEAIIKGGSLASIPYVGYRTLQYAKFCSLDTIKKRFGTPTSRWASPISFLGKNFNIIGPPMTDLIHQKEVIEKVYTLFGFGEYRLYSIGTCNFARPAKTICLDQRALPIDGFMSKSTDITSTDDIIPSFVYDFFLFYILAKFRFRVFDLSDIFTSDFINMSPNYANLGIISDIAYSDARELNLTTMLNMVY